MDFPYIYMFQQSNEKENREGWAKIVAMVVSKEEYLGKALVVSLVTCVVCV